MINLLKKYFYFGSVKPVSRRFGFDRGLPIDRYYIEKFLEENRRFIKGDVVEISERTYTKKFGKGRVSRSYVLNFERRLGVDFFANLETGEGVPLAVADCFIMTQTLAFIYDFRNVVRNSIKLVKPGGVILLTTGGVTQISRYDMERWGHYWSFTDLSLRKVFEEFVPPKNIFIKTYGNVKSSAAFLYGLAAHELEAKELDYCDEDYQLVVGARVRVPRKR